METRKRFMSRQHAGGTEGGDAGALEEMRDANSEAFSIIGTELAELKAMVSVLLDLQKSVIVSTGMPESDVERHVGTLLEAYRARFMATMTGRITDAADKV
jgi:sialic acid synthase SpsE